MEVTAWDLAHSSSHGKLTSMFERFAVAKWKGPAMSSSGFEAC